MSLSVDGVWKAGAWATTVWSDGVWREGAAPEEPPATSSSGPAAGGFSYMTEMRAVAERLHKRRKRLKRFLLLLG